jgi:radical SAM protein with 4Fe4S-binding SPASM domain
MAAKRNETRISAQDLIERAAYMGPAKSFRVVCNTVLKKADLAARNSRMLSSPNSIQIEPTTRCNLRCRYCISPVWDRRGMDMSFESFKKMVDRFPCLTRILMQGIGEPLLCKDLFRMIDYCRKKGIRASTITNATLIDDKAAQRLAGSSLEFILVSVDGASKETFESIRTGASFERVVENMKRLVAAKKGRKYPKIIINYTCNKHNIGELPDAVRLAREINADGIDAWGLHYWVDEGFKTRFRDESAAAGPQDPAGIIREAVRVAEDLGVRLRVHGLGSSGKLIENTGSCTRLFGSFFVTVDGYVTTCPDKPDPRKTNYGNIFNERLEDIWNGRQLASVRKARMEGIVPEQCRGCGGACNNAENIREKNI